MKKFIFIIITVIVALLVYVNVNASIDEIVIPDAAIRVRVIANSNSIHDQNMKMKVKSEIEKNISPLLIDVDDINSARNIISNSIGSLEENIEALFRENNYDKDFVVSFGNNLFPDKDYKGIHYEKGEYESLVVTIGEGSGDNWWCVLFPPLCLLEADDSDTSDVDYQFFVVKMLDKIFS